MLCAFTCGFAEEFAHPEGQQKDEQRILAILDPIDLHTQRVDADWGEFLRRRFTVNPKWKVIPHDTIQAKFKDYKIDPKTPCHEFQCAFDAGNVLSAEFVLFGSITNLDDMFAFTFNLVHVPTSQVIWSHVGEVRKRQLGEPGAALEATLVHLAEDLTPDQVRTGRHEKRGLLTVLDLSAGGSTPSRIMAERVATHLYASRNYDIMGKKEMDELLTALDINKAAFNPTDSSIFWLGGKMDITHLVYSRLLGTKNGGNQLQLALYDIAAKKKVREWPSRSTDDFRNLLEFENKFFASLFKLPEYETSHEPRSWASQHLAYAGTGAGVAVGAVFGYLAYSASSNADLAYSNFQDARSRESATLYQDRVRKQERYSVVYGVLSGLSLLGAAGFLVFDF